MRKETSCFSFGPTAGPEWMNRTFERAHFNYRKVSTSCLLICLDSLVVCHLAARPPCGYASGHRGAVTRFWPRRPKELRETCGWKLQFPPHRVRVPLGSRRGRAETGGLAAPMAESWLKNTHYRGERSRSRPGNNGASPGDSSDTETSHLERSEAPPPLRPAPSASSLPR